eukprot:3894672-Pyramimonas_sp.AAC.1
MLGGGDASGHRHWGPRLSSLWGHETLCCVGETHADTATGAFGGAVLGGGDACGHRRTGAFGGAP